MNLLRERSFALYFLGSAVSWAGTTITLVVMPILVFQLTGSAFLTGLLGAIEVVPYLVFGLFAGALADRVNRKRMMVACNIINVVLLSTIPIAAYLNALSVPQIFVVAILSATAFVWFDAANFGALPALAGRGRLVQANSMLQATHQLILIIGPALAGALSSLVGSPNAITLDAASYLISAVCLALITRSFQLAEPEKSEPTATSLWKRTLTDIREGLVYLWNQKLVRTLTLIGFGVSFAAGGITSLIVVYAVEGLGLADNDPLIGILFTAGAVGSFAAALLLPRLVRRYSPASITLVSLLPNALCSIALALAPNWTVGVIAYTARQMFYMLIVINGISLRQIVTPDHLQSRVNSTARMISWGGTPFGAAVGGLLAEITDIRSAFLFMSGLMLVLVVIGWFSPLRDKEMQKVGRVTAAAE